MMCGAYLDMRFPKVPMARCSSPPLFSSCLGLPLGLCLRGVVARSPSCAATGVTLTLILLLVCERSSMPGAAKDRPSTLRKLPREAESELFAPLSTCISAPGDPDMETEPGEAQNHHKGKGQLRQEWGWGEEVWNDRRMGLRGLVVSGSMRTSGAGDCVDAIISETHPHIHTHSTQSQKAQQSTAQGEVDVS